VELLLETLPEGRQAQLSEFVEQGLNKHSSLLFVIRWIGPA
jgi:hypothetical protein